MAQRSKIILGISLLWLPLSMLFDGLSTLILPAYLQKLSPDSNQASLLGLMSFAGLTFGMLIQLIAGLFSDRLRFRWGRRGIIGIGLLFLLPLLLLPEYLSNLGLLFFVYLLIQMTANIVQAALQGFMPDLVDSNERGMASGIKNLMDIGGALLVFMLLAQLFEEGNLSLALPLIAGIFLLAYLLTVFLVKEPAGLATKPQKPLKIEHIFQVDLQKHRSFVWLIVSRFFFLLGTYAVGRFLLYFVAERLALETNSAGEQSATILIVLTLITVLAAPLFGWLSDRLNRRWLMIFGGLISALGVMLLMSANSSEQMLIYGSFMAFGSAAFSAANWALSADFAPRDEAAHFLALANLGTAGAAAMAGIFGLLIDFGNRFGTGEGYSVLFVAAAISFLISSMAVRHVEVNEVVQTAKHPQDNPGLA